MRAFLKFNFLNKGNWSKFKKKEQKEEDDDTENKSPWLFTKEHNTELMNSS